MTLPISLVPVAVSAVRSLVLLRRKVDALSAVSRLDHPLPIVLPVLPPNRVRDALNDRSRMERAFAPDGEFRSALEARGLVPDYDHWRDPATAPETSDRLFFVLLGAYYEMSDEAEGILPKGAAGIAAADSAGLDQFLIRSAAAPGGSRALRILRASAEVLVNFLGDNASAFVGRGTNQDILASILREFAVNADLETQGPEQIVKVLLGNVALAATAPGVTLSDHPLAHMLIASLGRVQRDMGAEGQDFVARIITREGFEQVVSDWLSHAAVDPNLARLVASARGLSTDASYNPSDPSTLPPALQPVLGALSATLSTLGGIVGSGRALNDPTAFRQVFQSVLDALMRDSTGLIADGLSDRPALAVALGTLVDRLSGLSLDRNDVLLAPALTAILGGLSADANRDNAERLASVEAAVSGLFDVLTGTRGRANLAALRDVIGGATAETLLADLIGILGKHPAALARSGQPGYDILAALLAAAPSLTRRGLTAADLGGLLDKLLARLRANDNAGSQLVAVIMPSVVSLAVGERTALPLSPGDVARLLPEVLAAAGRDRAVWSQLAGAGRVEALFEAIDTGLERIVQHIGADAVPALVGAAIALVGRHGLALLEGSENDADPAAALRDRLSSALARAAVAATERIGRGVNVGDVAALTGRLADRILSAPGGIGDADLAKALESEIDLLPRSIQ